MNYDISDISNIQYEKKKYQRENIFSEYHHPTASILLIISFRIIINDSQSFVK